MYVTNMNKRFSELFVFGWFSYASFCRKMLNAQRLGQFFACCHAYSPLHEALSPRRAPCLPSGGLQSQLRGRAGCEVARGLFEQAQPFGVGAQVGEVVRAQARAPEWHSGG